MKLPDFLDVAAQPPGLRCLIIGGYALAHHGHIRPTMDVDFLARRVDRPDWHARLAAAHMVLASATSAFSQFNPVGEGEGLDLMWVDDPTFDAMERAGGVADFDGRPGRVVGLDHLLALKLHALRHASAERGSKDAADIEWLLRRHGISLDDGHYKDWFLRYGGATLHESFQRILRRP